MSHNNHLYELIERYLQDELSTPEKRDFEERLRTDMEFEAEYKAHKAANELIIDQELIKLKAKIQEHYPGKAFKNERKRNNRNAAGAVVSLVLVASLILWMILHAREDKGNAPIAQEKKPAVESKKETPDNVSTFSPTVTFNSNSLDSGKLKNKEEIKSKLKESIKETPAQIELKHEAMPEIASIKAGETSVEAAPFLPVKEIKISEIPEPVKDKKDEECILAYENLDIKIQPSCSQTVSGALFVNLEMIEGGIPPYIASLNEGLFSSTSGDFHFLPSGTYYLSLTDAKGCKSQQPTIVSIPEKNCAADIPAVFNPSRGETWPLPVDNGFKGTLRILDRAGNLQVDRSLNNNYPYTWDGTGKSNEVLPVGNYLYIILDSSERIVGKGELTLVR